jgi:WXG100 family type VII secretion target
MSDLLRVDFAALQQSSGSIQAAIGKMESQLSDLEAAARPLVDTWEGAAKASYQIRQDKWRQAANDLGAILRDIKGAVDESCASYQSTESRNRALFE